MATRKAQVADVPQMVSLSATKRAEYETYQPVFWHQATDADEQQQPFFETLVERENVIALVETSEGAIRGFVIATLVGSPPVYAPGGLTCLIDDFTVTTPDLWSSIGKELLQEATRRAKEQGAVQVVTVCGHKDEPKRALLTEFGCSIASEWWTQPL